MSVAGQARPLRLLRLLAADWMAAFPVPAFIGVSVTLPPDGTNSLAFALTAIGGTHNLPLMELIGVSLLLLGVVIFVIGGLLFLIAAFRESLWWGRTCLFIPIVQLFFLIVHWPEARKPFLLQLLAFGIILVGFLISPQTLHR